MVYPYCPAAALVFHGEEHVDRVGDSNARGDQEFIRVRIQRIPKAEALVHIGSLDEICFILWSEDYIILSFPKFTLLQDS